MNISSNYEYGSQVYSVQQWQKLLEKRKTEGASDAQDVILALGSTSQSNEAQKAVSPLADLVSDGTITSEQEQAIKEALDTARMAFQTRAGAESASSNNAFKDPLASLVSSGTLTDDQLNSVKSALESSMPQGMHGMKGMQGMPPPPPPSQQEGEADRLSGILDSLVDNGVLTEDQESSVLSALEEAFQSNSTGNSTTKSDTTEETDLLDGLVAAGTITEEQKEKIKSAFDESMKSQRMPPPPPPPSESSGDETSTTLSSLLDEMMKSGNFTSDQQQYIQSMFQSAMNAYSAQSYSFADQFMSSYAAEM